MPKEQNQRYRIYRSEKSRNMLCVVEAASPRAALKVARPMFQLKRGAIARKESREERVQAALAAGFMP